MVREALDLVLQLGRHDDSVVPAAKRVVLLCCDLKVRVKKDPELVARAAIVILFRLARRTARQIGKVSLLYSKKARGSQMPPPQIRMTVKPASAALCTSRRCPSETQRRKGVKTLPREDSRLRKSGCAHLQ